MKHCLGMSSCHGGRATAGQRNKAELLTQIQEDKGQKAGRDHSHPEEQLWSWATPRAGITEEAQPGYEEETRGLVPHPSLQVPRMGSSHGSQSWGTTAGGKRRLGRAGDQGEGHIWPASPSTGEMALHDITHSCDAHHRTRTCSSARGTPAGHPCQLWPPGSVPRILAAS